MLAKLAAGDMIAIRAKYHINCLGSLYNRARQTAHEDDGGDDDRLHGIAFGELVAFMEDMHSDKDIAPTFKLTDMGQLYRARLEQFGVTVKNRIHTTRLKLRLLSALPDLRESSDGRDVRLAFQNDIGPALRKACDHDSEAMHLVRAAQVVRKEMFDTEFSFDGSFPPDQCCAIDPIVSSSHDIGQGKYQASDSTGRHNHHNCCPFNLPVVGIQQRQTWTKRAVISTPQQQPGDSTPSLSISQNPCS